MSRSAVQRAVSLAGAVILALLVHAVIKPFLFWGQNRNEGDVYKRQALYYYLQADLRQLRRCLNGPLAREAELLAQTARRATDGSRRVFPLPKEAERLLEELIGLAGEPGPLDRLRTFQKLLQLLLIVCGAIRQAPPGDGAEGLGGPRAPGSPEHSAMALAMRYVQAHISEEISVEQLARLCSYSPSTFHAKFKQATGLPPHEYILRKKIDSACILLALSLIHIFFKQPLGLLWQGKYPAAAVRGPARGLGQQLRLACQGPVLPGGGPQLLPAQRAVFSDAAGLGPLHGREF